MPLAAGLVVAFLLLDLLTVRLLVYDSSVSGAYKVHRILEERAPGEISVIGSSRAKCCVIPDSLSDNAFNYGLNGADIGVVEFFLREAFRSADSAPLIVNVDLDWWSSGTGDPANWIPNAGHAEVRELMGPTFRPRYRVPFVRHFGLFDEYLSNVLKERISATEIVTDGAGLLPGSIGGRRMSSLARAMAQSGDVLAWLPDEARLDTLLRLVHAHPSRTVIFLVVPMHPSFFAGKTEEDLRTSTAWLDRLREPTNAHVLDYSRTVWSDSLFFDLKHLNASGARRFSRTLAADVDSVLAGSRIQSNP